MARVDFEPSISGIREVLKGGGVQDELATIVADIGRAANMTAIEHAHGGSQLDLMPFATSMDVAQWTAIGEVRTATKVGLAMESKYHILESFNH